MKTRFYLLAFAMVLLTIGLQAQSFQKGTLVGVHTMKVALKPGVTMDQFLKEYKDKLIPIIKSAYPEWQVYLTSSRRGDAPKGTIGIIYVIKSEKDRDKYFNADGSDNSLGQIATDKINKGIEKLSKFGTFETTYTDWIVQ